MPERCTEAPPAGALDRFQEDYFLSTRAQRQSPFLNDTRRFVDQYLDPLSTDSKSEQQRPKP